MGWCMVRCMHRTNVYLTAEEEAALDAKARAEGASRSQVMRDILDAALGLGREGDSDAADVLLLARAGEIAESARHLAQSDPDLRSA